MNLVFELFYLIGFTPWDRDFVPQALRRFIEEPGALSPGRVLDLGCGRGRPAIYLTKNGWTVTGVDAVQRALRTARRRASAAGVTIDFRHGDVTRLADAGVQGPFDLFFDSGCFHGLPDEARLRYGENVKPLAGPKAHFLVLAFGREGAGGMGPRGADRADIERALGADWELIETIPDEEIPKLRGRAKPPVAWYLLRRRPVAG